MKFSKRISYTLFFICLFINLSIAQSSDPTLFSVDGVPVKLSEFLYIYTKNNGKEADFSKKSLDEYLELYKNFKLKVAKAKKLRLDTLPELIDELKMYKQQVSNSYIIDKEVTESLIKEIYERQRKDISLKHVFFQLPPNPSPADTIAAYNRAIKAYKDIQSGVPFGKVVQENSDDRSNLNYSGDLGYITAMLPDGFYMIENTIYAMKIGDISAPVRSQNGYHILRVDDIRPARREIELAQILIKKPNPTSQLTKTLADDIYAKIQAGANFTDMVKAHSEDESTKAKDGYIGFIGINQFEKDFEDAVFALAKDGDISKPIESRIGFHIIKRLSKKEELPFAQAREQIKPLLESDGRYQYAKERIIDRIKSANGFKLHQSNIEKFTNALPEDFISFSWEVAPTLPDIEIFTLGNQSYSSMDFAHYMKSNTEERLRYPTGTKANQIVPALLNSYINEKVIEFEQKHLAEVYPEFKNLMREYEEGILLFEITRQAVWDKATTDSNGLKAYFDKNKSKYKWNERAQVNEYTVKSTDENLIKSIYVYAQKNSVEKTIKKFNKKQTIVSFQKEYFEKDAEIIKSLQWAKGFVTPYTIDKEKSITNWKKVENILPPSPKSLDDARGYVIADFQDQLEKDWLQDLRGEFKIDVDTSVFNGLIKK